MHLDRRPQDALRQLFVVQRHRVPSAPATSGPRPHDVMRFVPRPPPPVVADAREQEAPEAQSFIGVALSPEPGGGAKLGPVRAGGPADAAGLKEGDVLSGFEGNHVLEPLDVVPSGRLRRATFAARRGDEQVSGEVVLDGYRSDASRELVGSATVLGSLFLVMLVLGTRLGAAVTWLGHRIESVLGRRDRDGLLAKLVSAAGRGSDERQSSGLLAKLAPALVAVGLSLTFTALPFFEQRGRTELDLAILYLMSVTSLLAMALATGGWRAGKGALAGRFWAAVDVVVVELPAALALLAIVMLSGSLRVRDVVMGQTGAGGALTETGGWPWYWNAVKNPQLLALFFLFFATSLVEPAAPKLKSEQKETLRSMTFFFAGWMNVFVMCAILTTAFLGGYAIPGVSPQAQAQSAALQAAGAALFLAKCWGVVLVVLLMRAALPRLTPDFLVATGVRWVLPLSVVAVAVAMIGMTYAWVPTVERAVSLVTLTTALALALVIGLVVATALRGGPRLRPRVNTLI